MTETQHPVEPRIVPADSIPPDRLDPDALKVVRRLKECGQEAYLVGGCVRDLLLGGTPKDFDVATAARPRQVRRFFRNCRIIGRRFKLAHIVFAGRKIIETATFRKSPDEPASPEDRLLDEVPMEDSAPEIAVAEPVEPEGESDLLITDDNVFGNAEQDARRRDFTINALFYDPDRHVVIDYVGGVEDLEKKLIRTIGDPWVRFREDPVRILRAIKFATRLGFTIDPAAMEAMKAIAPDLGRSAPPRILEEILRLLRSGHAADSFRLLRELSSLKVILPELEAFFEETESAGEEGAAQIATFWKMLESLDGYVREGRTPTTALCLATLFYHLFLRRLAVSPAPGADLGRMATDIFAPIARRARISRFDSGRMQRICVAQRRFTQRAGRRFRPNHFIRMDYFSESFALFRFRCQSEGLDPEHVTRWQQRVEYVHLAPPQAAPPAAPRMPSTQPQRPPQRQAQPGRGGNRQRHGREMRRERDVFEPEQRPVTPPPKRDPDDPDSLLREEERDPTWGDW